MMFQRVIGRLIVVAGFLVLASPALAQSPEDAAHTPHKHSRAELINFGTYDQAPLTFQWDVTDVRQVPVRDRLDFVLTVDVGLTDAIDYFTKGYEEQYSVARLAPGVLVFQSARELNVIGHSAGGDPPRFTLGGNGMTRRFIIEISEAAGQTQIAVRNVAMGRLFSGVVPSRVGFKPVAAKPLNLLWN